MRETIQAIRHPQGDDVCIVLDHISMLKDNGHEGTEIFLSNGLSVKIITPFKDLLKFFEEIKKS